MATDWSPLFYVLYYEFPYLAVAEKGDIAVGNSLYLRFHDAAEESVAECEDFLSGVLAAHLVEELVRALLHGLLGLYGLVVDSSLYWSAGEVAEVALTQQRLLDEGAFYAFKGNLCCVEAAFEVAAEYNVELKLGNAWAQ